MVVRAMAFLPLVQCDTCLDFSPRQRWPRALPALAWRGILLTGFERREGEAMDLWADGACSWLEAFVACYPELGLAELARVWTQLEQSRPELAQEFRRGFFAEYKMRWSDRLSDVLNVLVTTPPEFQNWVDEKKLGARELSPLLALDKSTEIGELLRALVRLPLSKSQTVQSLEWVVELHLLDRPLSDLLPNDDNALAYYKKLERWRRPAAAELDEDRRRTVREWAWPAHVEGHWARNGDQTGLEIKIHTTSPQDFERKLSRLLSIRDAWSSLT